MKLEIPHNAIRPGVSHRSAIFKNFVSEVEITTPHYQPSYAHE